MTPEKLHILQHALGLDKFGQGVNFRNYYVVGPMHYGFNDCRELVAEGLMDDRGPSEINAGMHTFHVTDAGKRAVCEHSPPPPKLNRGQRRYRAYLSWKETTGGTFKEFFYV
jgi:hypothetical protein